MQEAAGGRFGRIPADTVLLMQQTVATVREQVLTVLPGSASTEVHAYAMETVLQFVLRDWSENENTSGLLPDDIKDLKSFIELAMAMAGHDLNGDGFPVFQATLTALMSDWLENWNAPGDPGPPGPVD